MTIKGIDRADSALLANINKLDHTNMICPGAQQVNGELLNAAELCRHACRVMKNKLVSKYGTLNEISEEERQFLISDILRIIANHRELWMNRNRIRGLEDSLEKLKKYYCIIKKNHEKELSHYNKYKFVAYEIGLIFFLSGFF